MESKIIIDSLYIIATILFIVGLKSLGHPRSAVRGNMLGAIGMLLAIVATLLDRQIIRFEWIIVGIAIGSLIGLILALTIRTTAMPQLVGLFNGFGGAASVLVAVALIYRLYNEVESVSIEPQNLQLLIAVAASIVIGAVTFLGSIIAFGKLQGIVTEKPVRYKGEQIIKLLCIAAVITLSVLFVRNPAQTEYLLWLTGVSLLLGVLLVLPVGGADMPVVIALLNSYSGLAAAATGFVLNNNILIVSGSLVGASGIILTRIMCRAMNRSLLNVLFGGVGAVTKMAALDDIYEGKVKSTSPEEVAMLLKTVQKVAIVPGYGMAVARAQTSVRILNELLEKDNIEVVYGIHPVAGRMPGHMNVLLAEENIPYEKLREMDQINSEFSNIDVVIVIGANDVVNPLAREAADSPIAGMPIMDVDKARTVIVVKRSLSPGFAGIPNPLFAADNTLMLFGDGKQIIDELVTAYKEA